MDWNDNDPFDSILKEFFGESPRRVRRRETFIEGEEEDRAIDFIETKDKVYLIFELPGFSQKDLTVVIKERKLDIRAEKKETDHIQVYLAQKLQRGVFIKKTLPQNVNTKKFNHTFKNGVLEISIEKRNDD